MTEPDLKAFLDLVAEMRRAQRSYSHNRGFVVEEQRRKLKDRMKILEHRVDMLIDSAERLRLFGVGSE